MRTSCASDLPSLRARQPGRLPELLDEDARPAVFGVVVYDNFSNIVSDSNPNAPGKFAYTALESLVGDGLYAAAARCYHPTQGHWMDDDPVGFAAGDTNLYCFVSDQRGPPPTRREERGKKGVRDRYGKHKI